MPNTLKDNVDRVKAAKTAIGNAIVAKGGTVTAGDGLEEFATDIGTIPTGIDPEPINDALEEANDELESALGGSSPVVVKGQVNFYDYDGTLVKSMSSTQFRGLENMPSNPTHAGLTAQGWNWSLAAAKTYVETYGSLDIGQMYVTDDGATRFYIDLKDGRLTPKLKLYLNTASTVLDVDWGDGSTHDTLSGEGYKEQSHSYASEGSYVISVTVTAGSFTLKSSSTTFSTIISYVTETSNSPVYAYNNSIRKIEIGSNVAIDAYAFYGCSGLSTVTLPNTISTIANYAFYNCCPLTSITLPNTVTSIAQGAFYNCYSLSSVSIPNTVTSIGQYAFQNCYTLSSVTLPNTVTSIGNYAFSSCYSLTSITLPNTVTSIGQYALQNCHALTSVTLPNTITSIGNNVFYNCYSLTSITIPNSVTSIGNDVFSGCYSLTSITLPNTVTSIGNNAFSGCYSLTSITLPNTVTSIGNYAFSNCRSLSSVTLPNTITSIGNNALQNCNALTSVTFPNQLTKISNSTCSGCYSLSNITIPNTVTSIGTSAFSNCTYVERIKFLGTVPPTVSASNAFSSVPATAILYAPALVVNLYMNGTNYPSKATYKYVGFATYESGVSLPTTTTDGTYTLTWYATQADAIAKTNPITEGNGSEVYARATPVT